MPWKNATPMTERLSFIGLYHARLYSMTELCDRFGISRKTGYKWLDRYQSEGSAGLEERSRCPKHIPQRISVEVRDTLLEVKRRHPTWGPRKVLPYLAARRPELALPAASTVGELFRHEGLT